MKNHRSMFSIPPLFNDITWSLPSSIVQLREFLFQGEVNTLLKLFTLLLTLCVCCFFPDSEHCTSTAANMWVKWHFAKHENGENRFFIRFFLKQLLLKSKRLLKHFLFQMHAAELPPPPPLYQARPSIPSIPIESYVVRLGFFKQCVLNKLISFKSDGNLFYWSLNIISFWVHRYVGLETCLGRTTKVCHRLYILKHLPRLYQPHFI